MKTKHILTGLMLLLLAACASIAGPDGGIYDEIPPKVVSSYPADRSTGVSARKMSIRFDEFIKLEKANEKVIVSPPQIEPANIRADGKRVKITLYDSLQANTTYTIDFADAIADNNEGNPMPNYTYSFSTGAEIDTMEVCGTVLAAENLEPVKGILVGIYPLDSLFSDSILSTTPLARVSRTNGSGQFRIKGVKNGQYRAFALDDKDGNFRFSQKSERIAFLTDTFTTSCKPDVRMDTIWHDSIHFDSIRVVPYMHFLPDDLVLDAFLEAGQEQHLLKMERPNPDMLKLYFTAPADTLPTLRGLNFDEKILVTEATLHNDTVTYWITDTAFTHNQDTMQFELSYMETDTLGQLKLTVDTLEVSPKVTWSKIWGERQREIQKWRKQREKRQKRSTDPLPYEPEPYSVEFLEIGPHPSGSLDPNQNIHYQAKEPILHADTTRMHLYIKKDTLWVPEPFLFLPDRDPKSYTLYAEWNQKETYRFTVDSTAITGVMGTHCKHLKNEFTVKGDDAYGSVFVHVIHPQADQLIVQLLNKSDKPTAEQKADAKGHADFFYVKPGEYYMRCFLDLNGNGVWDTGSYAESLQPEPVYYFPKPMMVKAKWDFEQDWEPLAIKRTEQKPKAITKQKPDKQKSPQSRNQQRMLQKQQNKQGGM